jgi:formiminoglutamase
MTPVEIIRGDSPVVLGMPHTGTWLPDDIFSRLTPLGQTLGDTDWHIHTLYDGLLSGATVVRATFHRYVVDANRDPSGRSLYPGQNTTGLVPMTNFDGEPLWLDAPTTEEIAGRQRDFHAPYHAALAAELERVRTKYGLAVLYDCHSIRSHIPFLFEGRLPDFNIGTDAGKTCDAGMESAVHGICAQAEGFTSVLNDRFKGGWTTRHYGRPADGMHAIQMELAQATYLQTEAPPFTYDARRAEALRQHLCRVLEQLETIALSLKDQS